CANSAIDRAERRSRGIGEEGAHEDAGFTVPAGEPSPDWKRQGQGDHEIRLGPGPEAWQHSPKIACRMWQECDVRPGIEEHDHMGKAHHGIEKDELPSYETALFEITQCGLHAN